MDELIDVTAERAVLSALFKYGINYYLDIESFIKETSFTDDVSQLIFKCFQEIFRNEQPEMVSEASVLSASNSLQSYHILSQSQNSKFLRAIQNFPIRQSEALTLAAKIRKLEISRMLCNQLDNIKADVKDTVTGMEPISQILGIAENQIFDFSDLVKNDFGDSFRHISDGLDDYIKYKIENPNVSPGISTGFPIYDECIGGGMRPGVSLIGARVKCGKSTVVDNIALYTSSQGIPTLVIDTEMDSSEHWNRILANLTSIKKSIIEKNQFVDNEDYINRIKNANKKIESLPFYYYFGVGQHFENILSLARQWLKKEVGFNDDGTAKKCVVLLDYLKMQDSGEMSKADLQEYQVLGFAMSALHNFAAKYKVPVLTFMQLNRDGVTKESTEIVSGSDRVLWTCSNFSILKEKSPEEIAKDGKAAGNRKIIPLISRHAGPLDSGDYINFMLDGDYSKFTELKTRNELLKSSGNTQAAFQNDDTKEQQSF